MLSLSLELRLALTQALQLVGGATESIFVRAEALLLGSSDYQQALDFIAHRKNADRYSSVMDFLFCELHPKWQTPCRRYYAGMGPQLKDVLTPEQVLEYGERLLKALEVAHELFCEQRRKSWGWYVEQVEEAIRAAA